MSAVKLPEGTLYQDKYNIYDPDKVQFAPRLEFMQALSGQVKVQTPLEDIFLQLYRHQYTQAGGSLNLYSLAATYKQMQSMNARLPKFSKWLTSMFVANPVVQEAISKGGQHKADNVVLSTDLVDILRSGDTTHFHTCYNIDSKNPPYDKMPVRISEETPGVMIAYVDDDKGKMMGRTWIQAVQLPDKTEAVMVSRALGNISLRNVVLALQTKGATVVIPHGWINNLTVDLANRQKAVPVGGFKNRENFDFYAQKYDVYPAL